MNTTQTDPAALPFPTVAVLYTDPAGPYPALTPHWYDASRDARTYAGPHPVVAHPPCGPWGKLAWRCTDQDPAHALHAVEVVQRYGGVLEHPVGSQLWRRCGLPLPGHGADKHGGYTLSIDQARWGHAALKPTLFYVVRRALPPIPPALPEGVPLRQAQRLSKRQRRLTPPALAHWLCSLAAGPDIPDPDPSTLARA